MVLIRPAKKPQKEKKLQCYFSGKSIESQDNATEEEGDKANDEHNAVNATITSKSIISAQRALNGILTPEMRSHIDRIA